MHRIGGWPSNVVTIIDFKGDVDGELVIKFEDAAVGNALDVAYSKQEQQHNVID